MIVLLWLCWLGPIAQASNWLASLPDGFPEGIPNSPYGAYQSVLGDRARPYQQLLTDLEPKVFGLAQLSGQKDAIAQAEAIYKLENLLVGTIQLIHSTPDSKVNPQEKEALLFWATRLYEGVRHHGERLFHEMIRVVDVKLPGATGTQQPRKRRGLYDIEYLPNHRSDKPLTAAERKVAYTKKLEEFLGEGSKTTEMRELTPKFLAENGKFLWVEFVERANGDVWVTTGKAGHVLLAEGRAVKAAGQLVLLLDDDGYVIFMVASNASGNYKPDLHAVQELTEKLGERFNIPSERIVLTQGEPLSPQVVKILLKAEGLPQDQIKARVSALTAEGQAIRAKPLDAYRELLDAHEKTKKLCKTLYPDSGT